MSAQIASVLQTVQSVRQGQHWPGAVGIPWGNIGIFDGLEHERGIKIGANSVFVEGKIVFAALCFCSW